MAKQVATTIRRAWKKLEHKPFGKLVFSRLFGLLVPYSGTIQPRILELGPGRATVQLQDHRRVRNHLNSVHAIALMNLAEMTSGLALVYGLPDTARAIITELSMSYLKKARGTLVAQCEFPVPEAKERLEHEVSVEIKNAAGEVVATARSRWLIGP
jgi:acyl-coenzyme A thioesterase PaaI-like protein